MREDDGGERRRDFIRGRVDANVARNDRRDDVVVGSCGVRYARRAIETGEDVCGESLGIHQGVSSDAEDGNGGGGGEIDAVRDVCKGCE